MIEAGLVSGEVPCKCYVSIGNGFAELERGFEAVHCGAWLCAGRR